jgi:adenosylhomocysteine nucleosidase
MWLRWIVQQTVHPSALPSALLGPLFAQAQPLPDDAGRNRPPRRAPEPASTTTPPSQEFLPCDVVLIFALGIEAGGVVDQLQDAETSRQPHGIEHAGRWQGREVVVVEGGVGPAAAARATAEAIRFYQPRYVISAGFAGALVDELQRGQLLLVEEVVNPAGQAFQIVLKLASPDASARWRVGRLVSVESVLRTPAERRAWAARSQAVACDMETFAVAHTCRQWGVPLLAVRVISDAVDDVLPPEIAHLLQQRTLAGRLGAAAGAVFRRLSAARDLWRLHEEALKASDRLARFLGSVVAQLPPAP